MAVAGTLVAMFASVSAHRYGFEFWGIRTRNLIDTQARTLHWAVTGRQAPQPRSRVARPRGRAPGRCWAAPRRTPQQWGYLSATGFRGVPSPWVSGNGVASSRKV